jgi:hypothetical protein
VKSLYYISKQPELGYIVVEKSRMQGIAIKE